MLSLNRTVMSPVARPGRLGTIVFINQELPPFFDTKIGAFGPPFGSGVKADPAIRRGLIGLTARLGSLSWLVSPLFALGIMLTTRTPAGAVIAPNNTTTPARSRDTKLRS